MESGTRWEMRAAVAMLLVLALGAVLAPGENPWRLAEGSPGRPRVVDLGTLGGGESYAVAINDARQVVGSARTAAGDWHAFLWEKGRMRDLATLGGKESHARALNNRGQVVGDSRTAGGEIRAFLWDGGRMRDLGTLPGFAASQANAINDLGQVVGEAGDLSRGELVPGYGHAFLWEKGKPSNLNSLTRPAGTWVLHNGVGINNRRQIVGKARRRGADGYFAFLWQAGALRNIGTPDRLTWAQAINARGEVAVAEGWATGSAVSLWSRGRSVPLGRAEHPHASVTVTSLNDHQVAAGCVSIAAERGVLLRPHHTLYVGELRRSGARMTSLAANGINNRGDVAGAGLVGGRVRACLLLGVPMKGW